MWVMTTEGFYSIVAHRKNRRWVLVRARAKVDLERLQERIDQLPAGFCEGRPLRGQIRSVRPSDYEFRMWVESEVMAFVLSTHVEDISYDNFKSAVAKVDMDREHIYHRVWAVLTDIGDRWGWRSYSYTPLPAHDTDLFMKPQIRLDTSLPGERPSYLDRDKPYPTAVEEEMDREDEILASFEERHPQITGIGDVAEFQARQQDKERKKKRRKSKKRFGRR